ncbi:MAG: aminopeptidase N, partial [Dehalococcoidia bacterium]
MTAPTANPTARDILTEEEAKTRAARISNCSYRLDLAVTAGAPTYRGDVTITFDDAGSGDTFLCFRGKTIEQFEVNGTEVAPEWNGYRLVLPG